MGYQPVWRRGKWVRQRYAIVDRPFVSGGRTVNISRAIVPVLGGEVREYDPLHTGEPRGRGSLLDSLVRLNASSDAEVESFCSTWGLAGLMQRSISGGVFRKLDAPESTRLKVRFELQDSLDPEIRAPYYWEAVDLWEGELSGERAARLAQEALNFAADLNTPGRPATDQLMDPRVGAVLTHTGPFPGDIWAAHFGSAPDGRATHRLFEIPEMWNWYVEPLEWFQEGVRQFQSLASLAGSNERVCELERELLQQMQRLRVRCEMTGGRIGGWEITYRFDSLLGAAYLMLAMKLTKHQLPKHCENCGKLFLPQREDQRFCKSACKAVKWQREDRNSRKGVAL